MKKKIIVVRQNDIKDCGPCTLSSIIQYYGGYVSIEKIRMDTYTSHEGTTVYHLIKALEKYGFDAVAKKCLDKKINNITLPAIVHITYENGLMHFMCLYEITNNYVILMDPAKGKIKMLLENFEKMFTGVLIEMVPKQKILFLQKESSIYALFSKMILTNKKLCFNTLLGSILLTIITIFSGLYFKFGYEMIETNAYENSFKYLVYIFFVLVVLKVVLEFIKNYYENYINKNIDISIYSNFIIHIFNLPLNVINTRSTGEIISRINEISSIKDLFSEIFISCFLDLLLSVGSLIILFYLNAKLTLIMIIFVIIYIIVTLIYCPYVYKRIRQNIDCQTDFNSVLIESIDMINSVKNLNKTKNVLEKIENKICSYIYDNFTFAKNLNTYNLIQNWIIEISLFVINTYGFYLIYVDKLSLVSLVVFNSIVGYFLDPIKNIVALFPKFNFLRASFKKICDFIDLEEEKLGTKEFFTNGDIKFVNVDFSYNNFHKTIENLNLTIKNGQKVMIKGPSGCGKSTICKLLYREYDPMKGLVLINDKNIMDYNICTIRSNITYVSQKENLFTDTIKNNILFENNNYELFEKICKVCSIDNIVSKRTLRYDFGIDNYSSNISGGEKQRIVLARALMQNSKILILDEALSEVDYALERKIVNNIIKYFPYKTVIYVSHKMQDKLFDWVIEVGKSYE